MSLSHRELVAIESMAFKLVKQCSIGSPPVDIDIIANSLSLTVFPYPLDEVSGALIIENGQAYIGYNPTHGIQRRRFTIGHEIGHYILHSKSDHNPQIKDQLFVDKDFIIKYRNANNYSFSELKQEQQANAFAAALLMPKEFIQTEIKKPANSKLEEVKLIGKLAELFQVSIPAMTFRLENMNALLYR